MNTLKLKHIDKDDASVLTKRTKGEKVLFIIVFVIFALYSLILIYPLLFLLINSFQDPLTYIVARIQPGYNPFA